MRALVEQITLLETQGESEAAYATYQFLVNIGLCFVKQRKALSNETIELLLKLGLGYAGRFIQQKMYDLANQIYTDGLQLAEAVELRGIVQVYAEYQAKIPLGGLGGASPFNKEATNASVIPRPLWGQLLLLLKAYGNCTEKDNYCLELKIHVLLARYTVETCEEFFEQGIQASVGQQDIKQFRVLVSKRLQQIEDWLQGIGALWKLLPGEEHQETLTQLPLSALRTWLAGLIKSVRPGGVPGYDLSPVIATYGKLNQVLLEKMPSQSVIATFLAWRKPLQDWREAFFDATLKTKWPNELHRLQQDYSQKLYPACLSSLWSASLAQLSEPPCRYALLGMGSLARGDMTPYSDLDLFVLLGERTAKTLAYFQTALRLFNIYVMSLGESEGELQGLHLDGPHLLGEGALFVTTPELLLSKHYSLSLRGQDWNQGERYSALTMVWLAGNDGESLLRAYRDGLKERLCEPLDIGLSVPKVYRQQLAAAGLRYDIGQYEKLLAEAIPEDLASWALNIKHRFVKPIVSVLQHLKLYFDLNATHPMEIAKLLASQQRLSEGLKEKLKLALCVLSKLRLVLQKKSHSQKDKASFRKANALLGKWIVADKSLSWLKEEEGREAKEEIHGDIFEISRAVIAPLHTLVREWLLVEETRPSPSGEWRVFGEDVRVYRLAQAEQPRTLTRYTLNEVKFHQQLRQLVIPGTLEVQQFSAEDLMNKENSPLVNDDGVSLAWLAVNEQGLTYYHGVLRPEIGEKLVLPTSRQLNTQKRYPYANHPVLRLLLGEVDIHAKVYPELPGLEVAIYLLSQRLVGGGVPSMTLGRLSWRDKEGVNQVEPLLLSETVVGLDGASASQRYPGWYESVQVESFWEQMVLTLLTQPEDAKPDNFILQRVLSQTGELVTKFWSIDQDHAFQEPLVTTGKIRKQTVLQTKSMLYCLNGMKLSLPESANEWGVLSAPESLGAWLKDCGNYDEGLRWLFGKENIARYLGRVHTQAETRLTSIPILLEQETIEQLYVGLYRLGYHVAGEGKSGKISFLSLLHGFQPQLGLRYGMVLHQALSPMERFAGLTQHAYSVVVAGHHQSMRGNPQVRQSGLRVIPSEEEVLNRSRYSPEECLGFVQTFLSALQKAVTEARVGLYRGEFSLFEGIKYWHAQEAAMGEVQFSVPQTREAARTAVRDKERLLQGKLVVLLLGLTGQWYQLRLVGWWTLTDVQLKSLLEKYRGLHTLELSGCVGLTDKGMEAIQLYGSSTLVVFRGRDLLIRAFVPARWMGISYGLSRLDTLDLSGCGALERVDLRESKFLQGVMLKGCHHLQRLSLVGNGILLDVRGCTQLTEGLLREWVVGSRGLSRLQLDEALVLKNLDKGLVVSYAMLLRLPEKIARKWCSCYRSVEKELARKYRLPILGEGGLLGYASKLSQLSYQAGLQAALERWLAVRNEVLPRVIAALLWATKDGYRPVQAASVEALRRLGESRESLLSSLKDKNENVQPASAWTLGDLSMFLWSLKDKNWFVRAASARVLGELGDTREPVLVALLSALKQDGYWQVRAASAGALGRLGDTRESVLSSLLSSLKDRYWQVRVASAEALGRLRDTREPVLSSLLSGLKDDGDYRVRAASARALGRLGDTRELVLSSLLQGLKDWYKEVQAASAGALGKLGECRESVLSSLLSELKDRDWSVRVAIAGALGRLGDARESVVSSLLSGLKDKINDVRAASAQALGSLFGSDALCRQLAHYMHRELPPILTLATQQTAAIPVKQPRFLMSPRQDPCQRLTADPLHHLFSWFHPKTLAHSRLVSRQWRQAGEDYVGMRIAALPKQLDKPQLLILSDAVEATPQAFGLSHAGGNIVIHSCQREAEQNTWVCCYRQGKDTQRIRWSNWQLMYSLQAAELVMQSPEGTLAIRPS